jgi:hypothetical protein
MTPYHILVISNRILARKKIQCGNKHLVFCTVLKWRVVFGAKWMVPTACLARQKTKNSLILLFTWDSVRTSFKNTVC